MVLERQWVITRARKGSITEVDMENQLGVLTLQEASLKRELMSRGQVLNIDDLDDWESRVTEYFADLREGLTSLNIPPTNEEESKEQFTLKRQVVLNLVDRVTIGPNRKLKVHMRLDLLKFLRGEFDEIKNNDTSTAILTSMAAMARHVLIPIPAPYPGRQSAEQLPVTTVLPSPVWRSVMTMIITLPALAGCTSFPPLRPCCLGPQ